MVDFGVIPLNKENIQWLYGLHEQVYGRKKKRGYYEAKYDTAWTGVQAMGLFARLGETVISFAGLVPCQVSMGSSLLVAAQSCDTMTIPDSQRKGVCAALAKKLYVFAQEQGIQFIYGFANQASSSWLADKLQFTDLGMLHRYTIPLSDGLFRKFMRRTGFQPKNRGSAPISNHLLDEGFDGIHYSEAYVRYKMYNQQFYLSDKECSAWLSRGGGLCGAWSGENIREVVRLVQTRTHASTVTFMCSPGISQDRQLGKIMAPSEGLRASYLNLSCTRAFDKLRFQLADIDIF
jgi:hypothetical protein